ncbi:bifunctional oligoribonuclease/PAP phosphatase NrnA [Natronoglomus mannanivorans]|uniref:Bifunctional oligoribonuclease/PAP phosphatase NrnA n=1 Tax=Natronoglomus mannanivorans TaxID=2979990 RepID=A0AAP2YXS2_9EURY|nr:bifunctional oligoribonuclease/PAP phosphatase NrnA [Halobacteria archaeon AArc-xg1-1]
MSRAETLASVLDDASALVIVCHDNPDPDCLASALALERIARSRDVEEILIVYGGEISHQQNRAFVNMLEIDVVPFDEVDEFGGEGAIEDAGCVAFVDHSQPGGNTEAPPSLEPSIIVDHHPTKVPDAQFADIRTEYGATATIFVEYLLDLDVPMTPRLASALLFALHRERLDFIREPTAREYEAALAVYPDADLEVLEQLYGTAFSPATIDAIGRAITTRERRGSSLVASVDRTTETDALPQAADYLLNLEGVDTVLVYGVVNGTIRMSGRSIDPRVHMGETLEDAYGGLGSAGGHHDMAGGRIELGLFADEADDEDELLSFVSTRLTRRFFDTLHLDSDEDPEHQY